MCVRGKAQTFAQGDALLFCVIHTCACACYYRDDLQNFLSFFFAITEICATFALSTKEDGTEEASCWQFFDSVEHRADDVRECCACAWVKCLLAKCFWRAGQ